MKPACSHVQVQIQNQSIHKHWAHLLRCLAWHSSCGMAFDWPGSSTTAHVSSDSTGLGTCFHSLQLILSLIEMDKKTIVISLCILSSLLPHWLTQHNLFSVGLQFLYPGRISPGPPPDMHFPCQILFMSLSSGHAKCISPSCTSSQLFLRTAIYLGMALCLLCPWHSVPRC